MKIAFQNENVTLWHGDCREVIPTLHGVDAVLCDPPYGIRHKSSHGATWEGKEIAGDVADIRRQTPRHVRDFMAATAAAQRADGPDLGQGAGLRSRRPSDAVEAMLGGNLHCRARMAWPERFRRTASVNPLYKSMPI